MSSFFVNIFLLAAIQGVLLTIFLIVKKNNQHANRVLAVAMFFLSVDILSTYLFSIKLYLSYPVIFGINFGFPFIYGPVFYIYTKILILDEKKFSKKDLLHFIPFTLAHLYVSPFYFLSHQEKLIRINQFINQVQVDLAVIGFIKPVHGILYTILSLKLINEFNKKIKKSFSNIDKKKLDWLRYLITGTIIVWLIVAVFYFVSMVFNPDYGAFDFIIYFSISLFIYAVGYGALNQPEVFTNTELLIVTNNESVKEKYEKSTLAYEDIQRLKTELLTLMNSKKLFLSSDLTLAQLSKELGITNHNLSEVINVGFNKNFYDFINEYRIEEFKERIKNPDFTNYSLLAIAFESGFSSKSSFNSIFKKYTNTTPSEYRKQFIN